MRTLVALSLIVALASAVPAVAQTNVGVGGGILLPTGDFGDFADPSPYIGGRWEVQDVNALGQVAVMSYLVQGGFAFLQTDSDLEALLDEAGDNSDGSYFDIGLGARVYSTKSPFFVGVGGSYVNVDFAGPGDSVNGFGVHAGLGLVMDTEAIKVDVEGRANFVLTDEDNLTHFQVLATIGLPFE